MRIYLSPPYLNGDAERLRMSQAFDSGYIAPCGPMVDALEAQAKALFGFSHALATVSGTMALELIARCLHLQPGDEVIASDLTFIASVAPFVTLGAKPVFVGSDATTWTLSPEALEVALKEHPRVRAVIATDLYGQCCDMEALAKICAAAGVKLIADAAESVGATYQGQASGTGAWATVYSLNGNKIVTCGGGGLLLSNDETLMQEARKLAGQAREACVWYEHRQLGTHGRLGNLPAAVACAQLDHLAMALADKAAVWQAWNERIAAIDWMQPMPVATYGVPNHWLTVITMDGLSPLAAVETLAAAGIESRPIWKPMHLQPVFEGCGAYHVEVDRELFARGLCLPSGRGLSETCMDEVITLLKKAHK